jgi:LuxR family maltose regulon positive regulatory protein
MSQTTATWTATHFAGALRRGSELIDRHRLFELLDEAAEGELVFVRAGAGAGKTALLTTWLDSPARRDRRGVFVELADEVAAAEAIVRSVLRALGDPAARGGRDAILELDADHETDFLLVLDDYTNSPESDALLEWLLAHWRRLHIVIASRTAGDLGAGALAGTRTLSGARTRTLAAAALLFTRDEIERLDAHLGADSTRDGLDRVHARTAGWPALVRGALDDGARLWDAGPAIESLLSSVTEGRPRLRHELARLSVAAELDPELAADLLRTPLDRAQDLLSALEGAGVALPSAARENVLGLLPLVREHLRRELSEGEADRLRDELADGYARLGRPLAEAGMLLQLERQGRAEELLLAHWCQALAAADAELDAALTARAAAPSALAALLREARGLGDRPSDHTAQTLRELRALATRRPQHSELVRTIRMITLREAGRQREAMALTTRFLARDVNAPPCPESQLAWCWAQHARTLQLAASPEFPLAVATATWVADRSGDPWSVSTTSTTLMWALYRRGQIGDAVRQLDRALAQGVGGATILHPRAAAELDVAQAVLAAEGLEIPRALRALERAGRAAVRPETPIPVDVLHRLLAEVQLQVPGAALQIAENIDAHRHGRPDSPGSATLARISASLYAAVGKPKRAREVATALSIRRPADAVLLARIALAEGDPGRCLEISTRLGGRGDLDPRTRVDALLLSATAYLRSGRSVGAGRDFGLALELAQWHCLRAPFLLLRRPELTALVDLQGSGDPPGWLERLPELVQARETTRLSAREIVVLTLLRETPSAAEIAEHLFVSPNTVKSQLKSLYRKLRVSSRDEAIVAALDLELLDP